MGIGILGLGNFLGGASQGYADMARIQKEKERLMLEAQSLTLQEQQMATSAQQFTAQQQLIRDQMAQSMGLATMNQAENAAERRFRSDEAARSRTFQMQQSEADRAYSYGLAQEQFRERGRDRLAANRLDVREALTLGYVSDLVKGLPEDQRESFSALIEPILGRSRAASPTSGEAAMVGVNNPYASFYKGGILGTLGR